MATAPPNRTGQRNRVSGIYHSVCHGAGRTVLEGQNFPRCGYCNSDTSWTFAQRSSAIGLAHMRGRVWLSAPDERISRQN